MSAVQDLRFHDVDETPLSREEVLIGLRDGSIPNGPVAKSVAFVVSLNRKATPGTNPIRISMQPIYAFDFPEAQC